MAAKTLRAAGFNSPKGKRVLGSRPRHTVRELGAGVSGIIVEKGVNDSVGLSTCDDDLKHPVRIVKMITVKGKSLIFIIVCQF